MNAAKIFISHTTDDDAIVAEIGEALEGQCLLLWADSREVSAGDDLNDTILRNIEQARHLRFIRHFPTLPDEPNK